MNEILKYDPNFTESRFKTYIDNVFIQLHLALSTQKLEKIDHFVNDEVYEIYQNKVLSLKETNTKQIYDEINVKSSSIISYNIINDKMQIKVLIVSRYMDYLIDNQGNYVSGNNQQRIEKNNYLIFEKKINAENQDMVSKCPGCGASINVNKNGKCEYCGTIYNLEEKGWLLVSIQTE